jgi:hypothetical protein
VRIHESVLGGGGAVRSAPWCVTNDRDGTGQPKPRQFGPEGDQEKNVVRADLDELDKEQNGFGVAGGNKRAGPTDPRHGSLYTIASGSDFAIGPTGQKDPSGVPLGGLFPVDPRRRHPLP